MERDFVEAPSQMLENWCWEKEPLKRMSSHYKGILKRHRAIINCVQQSEVLSHVTFIQCFSDSTPLPDDMLDTLIKSRNANTGAFNLRQVKKTYFKISDIILKIIFREYHLFEYLVSTW